MVGHKEWQPGKPYPAGISMSDFRATVAAFLNGQPTSSAPSENEREYSPFPGADYFRVGRRSVLITEMGRRLVAEGCVKYAKGPGPSWTEADRRSYAAWQRKLGYSGDDADGIPGPTSWAKLGLLLAEEDGKTCTAGPDDLAAGPSDYAGSPVADDDLSEGRSVKTTTCQAPSSRATVTVSRTSFPPSSRAVSLAEPTSGPKS